MKKWVILKQTELLNGTLQNYFANLTNQTKAYKTQLDGIQSAMTPEEYNQTLKTIAQIKAQFDYETFNSQRKDTLIRFPRTYCEVVGKNWT